MISSDADRAFAALAAQLALRARALAAARIEAVALARRDDPRRWRLAHLVWPLFGKGQR